MEDLQLGAEALTCALQTAETGENHEHVLDRARDYYQFLSGKSPDHRPAPRDLKAA